MKLIVVGIVLIIYLVTLTVTVNVDRQCAARHIYNRSIVCVCNRTYCDEITRDVPKRRTFVTYTTSKSGSRLKKGFGAFHTIDNCLSANPEKLTLVVNPEKRFQTIKGFGGAVTDSVAIIWRNLPAKLQEYLIESYFGNSGIGYNLIRVPIGASDFSVRNYSLDDCPEDVLLENFSLEDEDYEYKIPMIKEVMKVSQSEVDVIGSAWSSPRWMKETTAQSPTCGFLKYQYFQTYADYLLQFIESYDSEGIPIWAMTTGNEPSMAYLPDTLSICLGWATKDLGNWIVNNFGPTIRNSKQRDVKILAMDDQRYSIKLAFEPMVQSNSKVLDYIDGVAVHYYADAYVSPDLLSYVSKRYSKFVISTEASTGTGSGVDLGSWDHAITYAKDIIQDLTNDVVGWVDWNLFLNTQGGPNMDGNYVDSPIIVDAKTKEFVKQPMYYILGQFSKFIPRNSQRIEVTATYCDDVHQVAFLTPYNTIVVVICNRGISRPTVLQLRNKEFVINLEENSITTVEFRNEFVFRKNMNSVAKNCSSCSLKSFNF